jgi:hypothetical protein
MRMCQISVLPLEDHRLTANSRVDVKDHILLRLFFIFILLDCIVVEVRLFSSLNNVQVIRLLFFTFEIVDLGHEAGNVIELEFPLGRLLGLAVIFAAFAGCLRFFTELVVRVFLLLMVLVRSPPNFNRDKLESPVGL